MTSRNDVAKKIFPQTTTTPAELLQQFPPRKNPICSRFAPSPTGFLHIWGVFTAFVTRKFVKQQEGNFVLRIEDTDQKRKVEGAVETLISSMKRFWITIDEGPIWENNKNLGEYGPYTQSERKEYYHSFVKDLIARELAYPCWMTEEEIESLRNQQTRAKVATGIYGNYSLYRNKTPEEILQKIDEDPNFIIRFRSTGAVNQKIVFEDILRGKVHMIDNYNDIVLIKKDGLPTYHMAHIVDDTLMRTSHIIRAEEWLTSVPLHLQLFKACELEAPKYCHLAQLLAIDEETGKKRKLSKRKDPQANVEYFFEQGYAVQGILDYLYTLADSSFEDWQKENTDKSCFDRELILENMNKSGALFDETKMKSVNNEYLSRISTEELYNISLHWAKSYHQKLQKLLEINPDYAKSALNIERHTEKDPKRFYSFFDVYHQLVFFFDEEWEKLHNSNWRNTSNTEESNPEFTDYMGNPIKIPTSLSKENLTKFINDFIAEYTEELDLTMTTQERFDQLKIIGKKYGFAMNNKEFKEWWYIWKIGELAMFLRLQLCCSGRTPDLFSVMQVLWKEKVIERLQSI